MADLKVGLDSWNFHYSSSSSAQTVGWLVLAAIGGLFLATRALSLARTLLSLFVIPGKPLRSFGPRGSWALITGASDGIGKEYALQISKQGYNLLLVSRTQSKLDTLASEIKSANKVQVETLAMDFSTNKSSDYDRVSSLITGKDISILINNVGQSHSIPVSFAETEPTEINNIININCFGTLKITQLVLPGMLQRKRGLILTMGSFGGQLPTPYLATYSGSKAFLQQWSTALASEVASSGVFVHFVHSYLVTSAMSKVRRPTALIPPPKPFVKATLNKIGNTGGSINYAYSGSPFWSHGLAMWFILTTVGAYSEIALAVNRSMHLGIRKAALRKKERERKKLEADGGKKVA